MGKDKELMTDEELRKEILQRVYNKKARYVVRDINGEIYAYDEKPKFDNDGYWWGEGDIVIELTYFDDLFPDLHMSIETLLDIGKELEIVNWEQVKRDTQVIVSNDRETWHNRYFFKYMPGEELKYWTYAKGQTGWSSEDLPEFWEYCKLA